MNYLPKLFANLSKTPGLQERSGNRYAPYPPPSTYTTPRHQLPPSGPSSPHKSQNLSSSPLDTHSPHRSAPLKRGDAVFLLPRSNFPNTEPEAAGQPRDRYFGMSKTAARTPDGQHWLQQQYDKEMRKRSREMDERPPPGCEWAEEDEDVSNIDDEELLTLPDTMPVDVEDTARVIHMLCATRTAAEENAAMCEQELFESKIRWGKEHAKAEKARQTAERACCERKEEELRLNRTIETYNRRLLEARKKEKVRLSQHSLRHQEEEKRHHLEKQRAEEVWLQKLEEIRREKEILRLEAEERLRKAEAARIAAEDIARHVQEELQRAREEHARHVQEWERERQAREEAARRAEEARLAELISQIRQHFKTYEEKWKILKADPNQLADGSIAFVEFPWPVLPPPQLCTPSQITRDAIQTFIFHDCRPEHVLSRTPKEKVNDELLRFHPDKFSVAILQKIVVADREATLASVNLIVCALNDLKSNL
jgi:hypothetical protein